MKLRRFTIKNYRSIVNAEKLELDDMTVLVGPNNEGKSNIVRGLATAMNLLVSLSDRPDVSSIWRRHIARRFWNYEADYPVALRMKGSSSKTIFTLVFELDDSEIEEFKNEIRSSINGTLPIQISIPQSGVFEVAVPKKGPGQKTLTKKSMKIVQFVAKRIDFNHIPAVRTATEAQEMIAELISKRLLVLDANTEYQNALKRIESLQKPILKSIQESLSHTLEQFVPNIKSVELILPRERRARALRTCDVYVDDGVRTKLSSKGDGIQSITALAIMKHVSETNAGLKSVVVAVEEPESHLHPTAQHELRAVIAGLSVNQQVIVTTHCPIFVDRSVNCKNIIVKNNRATSSSDVSEIREVLGVRASDNLKSSEVVVLVEGDSDSQIIKTWIEDKYPILKRMFSTGIICFDSIGGAGSLSYKVNTHRSSVLCVRAFLDNDDSGNLALDRAVEDKILSTKEIFLARKPSFPQSEIEDLLDPRLVKECFRDVVGIDMNVPKRAKKLRFGARYDAVCTEYGKPIRKNDKTQVKADMARKFTPRDLKHNAPVRSLAECLMSDVLRLGLD